MEFETAPDVAMLQAEVVEAVEIASDGREVPIEGHLVLQPYFLDLDAGADEILIRREHFFALYLHNPVRISLQLLGFEQNYANFDRQAAHRPVKSGCRFSTDARGSSSRGACQRRHPQSTPRSHLVFLAAGLMVASCEESRVRSPPAGQATLDDVFSEVVLELGEDTTDSIAEIGAFAERANGGFLIADRLLPRVRSYAEDGRLEAAFGRFGEGPFEFRRIDGVAEGPSGHVVVVDRRTQAWSSYQFPFVQVERPYWGSYVRFPMAVAGDSIFVMSSLRYPVSILNGSGDTVGTMGVPSESFRPIPVLERGAFSDPRDYTTLSDFFASFDVIDRVDVVGSHLVLTQARFDHTRPTRLRPLHFSLEVYDRHTGAKLYGDVPLPAGSRVLGGGRFLYLLMDRDFPPWRIAKLRLRKD